MKRIAQTGSIRDIQDFPKDVRRLFVTAHYYHPAHQAPGGLPKIHRQRRLQDRRQLPQAGHRRRCPPGLSRPTSWASRASPSTATPPGRQVPELRRRRRGPARHPHLHHPPPPAGADHRCHRSHQHRLRQALRHGEPGPRASARSSPRWARPAGLRLLPDRIHRPPHFAGPALRRHHRIRDSKRSPASAAPAPTGRTAARCSPAPTPSPRFTNRPVDQTESAPGHHGLLPRLRRRHRPEGGCLVCRSCGFSRCS